MTDFIRYSNNLSLLTKEAKDALYSRLKTKTLEKGEYLLKTDEVCRHIFFIDKGLVKTCFYKSDKEFIMRFFPENSMFTVLDSYIQQTPSLFIILALEHTEISYITNSDLEELCKSYHCIETYFRKLVSFASVNMMKRISEMLE